MSPTFLPQHPFACTRLACAAYPPGKPFVFDGLERSELVSVIDRTFTFDQIREAQNYVASNQ